MSFPRFGIALARDRLSRRHLQSAIQQARLYDPPGAMDAGFLDSVHPPEQVERAAVDHAQVLAETLHRGAFRVTRERLRGDIAREAAAGLELDIDEIGAARRR